MTKLTPVDQRLSEVILEAYRRSYTTQSDFARMYADLIAMAASMGLLSTRVYGNVFSKQWRPTVKGLQWLEEKLGEAFESDEELDEGHD